jgi:hypothetical protein
MQGQGHADAGVCQNWDGSVGIETGYGMDDRGVGVRVPVRSHDLVIQTGFEIHPVSCVMGTEGALAVVNAAGA